jgi:hypothetical protein
MADVVGSHPRKAAKKRKEERAVRCEEFDARRKEARVRIEKADVCTAQAADFGGIKTCGCSGECLPSTCQKGEWIDFAIPRPNEISWPEEMSLEEKEYLVNSGKWMLFFKKDRLDEIWEKAKLLLVEGKLLHIYSMKISTIAPSVRRGGTEHALILYCSSTEKSVIEKSSRVVQAVFAY